MSTNDYLIAHQIKPSVHRLAIMNYLCEYKTHPTAEEIYNALYPSIPTLSKTTVYNTLKLFAEQGVALCLSIDDKNSRFDANVSKHAHFICLECGCVHDVPVEQLDNVFVDHIDEFLITDTQIYYKGYCKDCKEKHLNY